MRSSPIEPARPTLPLQRTHTGFPKMQILLLTCVCTAGPPTQTGETHSTAIRGVNVETGR
jgi:hypothetical protein